LIEPNQQIGSISPGDEQLNILISPTRTKDIAMNSLEAEEMKKLAVKKVTNARSVNKVKPGLTLHSKCKNPDCEAYGKPVKVSKGMG